MSHSVALVSDIHGNLPALEAVLADAHARGAERIVNLGDSLSGPLLPRDTARFLMAQDWVQLAGNHERQLLEFDARTGSPADAYAHAHLTPDVFDWMKTLVHARALDDEVFLCHGSPRSDVECFLDSIEGDHMRAATPAELAERCALSAPRVVACGHTHLARIAHSARGQLLVNPGSVGLQAYTDDLPQFHTVENGDPRARYAILERAADGWRAQLHAVEYDCGPMAALALRNGRPDWEVALRTGRMVPG